MIVGLFFLNQENTLSSKEHNLLQILYKFYRHITSALYKLVQEEQDPKILKIKQELMANQKKLKLTKNLRISTIKNLYEKIQENLNIYAQENFS